MALTLAQLLAAPAESDITADLLAYLQGKALPVTDWADGGVARTLVEMESDALYDLVAELVPKIAGGGLVNYSEGSWLELLASEVYNLARTSASFTTGNITLTAAADAGPHTITPGELWFVFPSGNRYSNTTGGVLALEGSLVVAVMSEAANDSAAGLNYTDGSGQAIAMVTPLPGVTATNPAPDFTAVTKTGQGTGTITTSRTASGTPPTTASVTVLISATGQVGAATFQYRIGAGSYSSAIATAATYDIAGYGIRLAFANGSVNPSFIAGDTYTFAAPGSWISSQGRDTESDTSLQSRAKARWPSLSSVPTESVYALWAKQASTQVTRVKVVTSTTVGGGVDIYIAGQAGTLGADVVNAVQSYVNPRMPLTDRPVVTAATAVPITLGGIVTVRATDLAAAQARAQTNVSTLISNTDIGGTVYVAGVVEALMEPTGAINASGITINGDAADLELDATEVAMFAQSLASALTWVPA